MTRGSDALRAQIELALSEVTAAETYIEETLRELRVGPRAEKVTVTEAVEGAFTRLRAARAELARLRELVGSE